MTVTITLSTPKSKDRGYTPFQLKEIVELAQGVSKDILDEYVLLEKGDLWEKLTYLSREELLSLIEESRFNSEHPYVVFDGCAVTSFESVVEYTYYLKASEYLIIHYLTEVLGWKIEFKDEVVKEERLNVNC